MEPHLTNEILVTFNVTVKRACLVSLRSDSLKGIIAYIKVLEMTFQTILSQTHSWSTVGEGVNL